MMTTVIFAAFILLISSAGYFSIGYLSDDHLNIISAGSSSVQEKFSGDVPYYSKFHYRPLWFLCIQGIEKANGFLGISAEDAILQRFLNLALLITIAFMCGRFVLRYSGNVSWSGLAAVIVLTYPNNLNSICWSIGLVDLLCGLLMFASVYYTAGFFENNSVYNAVASCFFLILALLTKETAIVTPLASAIIISILSKPGGKRRLGFIFILFIIALAYLIFRLISLKTGPWEVFTAYADGSFSGRLGIVLRALVSLMLPFDYLSLRHLIQSHDFVIVLYIIFLIAVLVYLFNMLRKQARLGILIPVCLMFLTLILPNIAAGYFRPQLILIPFIFTVIAFFISMNSMEKGLSKVIAFLLPIVIFWMSITPKLFGEWRDATELLQRSVNMMRQIPENEIHNAVVLGLPGRLGQAHVSEYVTGAYNYFLYGAMPVQVNINDIVHVSALDITSLNSVLVTDRTEDGGYQFTASGATQYFQVTGSRTLTASARGINIMLDSLNDFGKPVRMKVANADNASHFYIVSGDTISKFEF